MTDATTAQCPVTHGFNPFDPAYANNPYDFYREARTTAPVSYSPEFDLWIVSRFEDIVTVLKDRETYSASNASAPFCPVTKEAQAIMAQGYGRVATFSNCDAPRHTIIRKAAMSCLNPRRWASVQPRLTDWVNKLVDGVGAKEVSNIGEDLILPLTSTAGFTLIGFPSEDHDMLLGWCDNRVQFTYGQLSSEEQIEAAQDMLDFWNYCKSFVRARLAEPVDDLTSDFLALAQQENATITVEDVDSVVFSLALASHETTANAILNGLIHLLPRRDLWNRLRDDRTAIPKAVDELMRFESPTVGQRRLTKNETVLGGVTIPAGATVVLLNGSGNRDPDQFTDPDTIDIDRPNANEHLAFGKKWHFCLGAPLARFEYQLVLNILLDRFPAMTLASDQPIAFSRVLLMRGPQQLLVRPNADAN